MHIADIFKEHKITFSFEFFPPKTDKGWSKLFTTISDLMPLEPAYVSVTYGAGGSTREKTHDIILEIMEKTDLTVVSHLTCVNSTRAEMKVVLDDYAKNGVKNILALKGDLPHDGTLRDIAAEDGFEYASDLVAFIKEHHPDMGIGVAGFPEGHPDTPNRLKEMEYLKAKVDAGADYIVTQLFFDNRDFYDFKERCELTGITVPIIAGIMPIATKSSMVRMAELSLGSRIPARLQKAVLYAKNDDDVEKIGMHWATEQVRDLVYNNVQGIHFYTLNNSKATLKIYDTINLLEADRL
ncbi:MAG: methylenetetrahydrofolate reductase [NAD(P)H] [Fibrobacterales bacterium]